MDKQSDQRQQQLRRYRLRVLEVVALFVFIVVFAVLLAFLMQYILPFVIGWILAILLIPLVQKLEKHGMGRTGSVMTILSATVAILVAAMASLVVAIAHEANMLTSNSTGYFVQVNTWIVDKVATGKMFYSKLPPDVADKMKSELINVLSSMEKWLQSFAAYLLTLITHLPETLFVVVIALITTYFILANHERMMSRFLSALPPGWSGKFRGVLEAMSRAFVGSIRVQVILVIMSIFLGILGLWILRFPYAVILGVVFGLAGIIPILGSAILTVPWAIGALLMGDISVAFKLLLLQIVVSIIRHLIEPKILADSVGLDTLSTLFALYVGMKSLGVLGLFLGPIILIGVKSLFATHLFVDFLPHTMPDEMSQSSAKSLSSGGGAKGEPQ
jgi:sporulation integral membrane protein YtvI